MIRLIGIDLDGTLLTDDKQLPPGFRETAGSLLHKGVAIVIASGRPYTNLSSVFEDLKDQLYFASDNGTYVVHNGNELLINPLPKSPVNEFIEISRTIENVYPVVCGKDMAMIESTDTDFMEQALKYYQEHKVVSDLTKIDELILKVSFCDLRGAEINSYPHFQRFRKDYSIAVAGKMWLDITDLNGNKGNALKVIQKHLNVTPDETLVFGDYLNDLEMLRNAKYSYAMKNAHPDIIEAARFVTRLDNNQYGVMDVIRELIG